MTLAVYIMFVKKLPFLISTFRQIIFGTIEMNKDQNASNILKAVRHIVTTYKTGGFQVTSILGYGQIEALRGPLSGLKVELKISSINEYVPEIERYIRTAKE